MEVKHDIIIVITSFLELLERLFHPRDNFRGDNVYCHRSIVNVKCSLERLIFGRRIEGKEVKSYDVLHYDNPSCAVFDFSPWKNTRVLPQLSYTQQTADLLSPKGKLFPPRKTEESSPERSLFCGDR